MSHGFLSGTLKKIAPYNVQKAEQPLMSLYKPTLQRIQSGSDLLDMPKRKNRVLEITRLLDVPDQKTFDKLCLPVLNQVAELTQQLAKNDPPRFQYTGGHLDYLLERCAATLRLLHDHLRASDAADYILANPQLWHYTLFTAVLLQYIGEFVSHYTITLFNQNKENIGTFSPFLGNMSQHGAFYSTRYRQGGDSEIRDKATLLLAQQIMPTAGLIWISKNDIAFDFWLRVLTGNLIERDSRRLTGPRQLLTEALARILNRSLPAEHLNKPKSGFLDENPLHQEAELDEKKKADKSMAALLADSYDADNTDAAEKFLKELQARLDFSELTDLDDTNQNTPDHQERIKVNSEKETYQVYLTEAQKKETALFVSESLIKEEARKLGVTVRELVKQLGSVNALATSPQSQTGNLHYLALQNPEGARALGGLTLRNIASLFPALGPNIPRGGIIPASAIPPSSPWPTPVDTGPTQAQQQAQQAAESAEIASIVQQQFFK